MISYASRALSRSKQIAPRFIATAMSFNGAQQRAGHIFAPLRLSQDEQDRHDDLRLQGVVFDMDGTLCEPQNYMFQKMREAVNIPTDQDILDYVHSLPDGEQAKAFSKIQEIERQAMANQVPQPGLVTLMEYLDQKGIKKAICTRNFDAPVENFLEKHVPTHLKPFGPIITRDFRPPKPSPAGILHIAHSWSVVGSAAVPSTPRSERLLPLIMVGDSIDDMISGHEAGALTVLLRSEGKEELESDDHTDVAIGRLDELISLLETGLSNPGAEQGRDAAQL